MKILDDQAGTEIPVPDFLITKLTKQRKIYLCYDCGSYHPSEHCDALDVMAEGRKGFH